jgi:hypothetical protein
MTVAGRAANASAWPVLAPRLLVFSRSPSATPTTLYSSNLKELLTKKNKGNYSPVFFFS